MRTAPFDNGGPALRRYRVNIKFEVNLRLDLSNPLVIVGHPFFDQHAPFVRDRAIKRGLVDLPKKLPKEVVLPLVLVDAEGTAFPADGVPPIPRDRRAAAHGVNFLR